MYRNTVTLTPDEPNRPLKPAWVGTNSSALFVFDGVPAGAETVKLYLTKVGASVAVYFDVSQNEAGEWYALAGGANFPTAGQGSYEVEVTDEDGNKFWCGRGIVTVQAASGGGAAGAGTPADTWIRNPATGKYHRLIVTVNELGEVSVGIDSQGEELA
jgi:hypothetical protein